MDKHAGRFQVKFLAKDYNQPQSRRVAIRGTHSHGKSSQRGWTWGPCTGTSRALAQGSTILTLFEREVGHTMDTFMADVHGPCSLYKSVVGWCSKLIFFVGGRGVTLSSGICEGWLIIQSCPTYTPLFFTGFALEFTSS